MNQILRKVKLKKINILQKQADLWQVDIRDAQDLTQSLFELLSNDEKDKVDSLRFKKNKAQYVVSRGILKLLLSYYLKQSPELITISYTEKRKPFVEAKGKKQLFFNVSHSENLVLFGFSQLGQIGVDIEFRKNKNNYDLVSQRFFLDYELNYLSTLPLKSRTDEFMKMWVLKEAYIKAIGRDISHIEELGVNSFGQDNIRILIRKKHSDLSTYQAHWFIPERNYFAGVVLDA